MVQAGMEAEAAEYLESFQAIVGQQKALVARMRRDLEACDCCAPQVTSSLDQLISCK
jgi:hypothetical protein